MDQLKIGHFIIILKVLIFLFGNLNYLTPQVEESVNKLNLILGSPLSGTYTIHFPIIINDLKIIVYDISHNTNVLIPPKFSKNFFSVIEIFLKRGSCFRNPVICMGDFS